MGGRTLGVKTKNKTKQKTALQIMLSKHYLLGNDSYISELKGRQGIQSVAPV